MSFVEGFVSNGGFMPTRRDFYMRCPWRAATGRATPSAGVVVSFDAAPCFQTSASLCFTSACGYAGEMGGLPRGRATPRAVNVFAMVARLSPGSLARLNAACASGRVSRGVRLTRVTCGLT